MPIPISIIVPIFGIFDTNRASMTVASIQEQIGVELEIVVTEEGDWPRFKPDGHNIRHVFTRHESGKPDDYNYGLIRNRGVEASSGEFVYTTDADIIFRSHSFLARSIAMLCEEENIVFRRPPIRRLPESCFEKFHETFTVSGLDAALSVLDFSQDRWASIRENPVERPYDPEKKAIDRRAHCGGNLFRRKHFEAVGRYCELFQNYGYEDYDLQWKLAQTFNMLQFPDTTEFEALHLNHQKTYRVKSLVRKNSSIFFERQKSGVREAIGRDIERLRLRAAQPVMSVNCASSDERSTRTAPASATLDSGYAPPLPNV